MQLRKIVYSLVATLVVTIGTQSAFAHEFWLMPIEFNLDTPGLLRVQTLNGERFDGTVLPRRDEHIARYEVLDSDGKALAVLGRSGQPVSIARLTSEGAHRVVYQSVENPLTLDAEAFEDYLAEEGLSEIIGARADLGESEMPGREVYVRCAKAIVIAGEQRSDNQIDKSCGLPLEIVIEGNGQPQAAMAVSAIVRHNDEPKSGLHVVAVSADDPSVRHELESDSEGRVQFVPDSAGVWMLTTITMDRLENRDDADWKSWWSSVTFKVVDQEAAK